MKTWIFLRYRYRYTVGGFRV